MKFDRFATPGQVFVDPEIGAFDGGPAIRADPVGTAHEYPGLVEPDIKGYRVGDPVKCEVAGDVGAAPVARVNPDGLGWEGCGRKLFGIEWVRRLEKRFQRIVVGCDIDKGNGRFEGTGRRIGRVERRVCGNIDELPDLGRKAHVIHRPGNLSV